MKKLTSLLLTLAMLATLFTAVPVNAENTWDGTVATSFAGGGSGSSSSPYLIGSAAELLYASNLVNGGSTALHFKLIADIDYENNEWIPFSHSASTNYSGTFDGDGYIVKNLKITDSSVSQKGFFGQTSGATIKNLGIENMTISISDTANGHRMGALVCRAGGTITNCYVKNSTVHHTGASGEEYGAAGFVGSTRTGTTISDCYVYGTDVKGCGSHVGAFLGQMEQNGTISNCYVANTTVTNTAGKTTFAFGNRNGKTLSGGTNYSTLTPTNTSLDIVETASDKTAIVSALVTAGSAYAVNSGVNGGYPYLSTQKIDVVPDETPAPTVAPTPAPYAGGTGTETDPYLISNATQLAYASTQINSDATAAVASYKLTADIDFGGAEWTPIGRVLPSYNTATSTTVYTPYFSGTFDGDNHIISNIKITNSDRSKTSVITNYNGFFGRCVNATIKNLAIDGMTIEFYNHDYYYTDTLRVRASSAGVMAGEAYNTKFTNCYVANSSVRNMQRDCGDSAVGGFVGNVANSSSFENCYVYNTGICSGQNACLGGFFGCVASGAPKFINCFAAAVVQNTEGTSHGVLATTYGFGCTNGQTVTVENCYSTLADVRGTHYCEWCISRTYNKSHSAGVSAMSSDALIAKVMENGVYCRDASVNGGYPYLAFGELKPATEYAGGSGTADDPFIIATAAQLLLASKDVNEGWDNAHFKLVNDIDYNNYEWIPIGHNTKNESGTSSTAYKGSFDGNGHVIKNLKITNELGTYHYRQLGFFGNVQDVTIKNLGIENIVIEAYNCNNPTTNERIGYMGGFAAFISGSSLVENCYVKNSSVRQMDRDCAEGGLGGFVGGVSRRDSGGVSYYPQIKNCYVYNTDIVSGQMVVMGGFAGSVSYGGDIKFTNCYAADITSTISDTTHKVTSTTYGFGYKGTQSVVPVNCYSTSGNATGTHKCNNCTAYEYDEAKAFGVSGASKEDITTAFKDTDFIISDDINEGYPHLWFETTKKEENFMIKSVQPEITTVEASQYTVDGTTTKKWTWETLNNHTVTVNVSRTPGVTTAAKVYVATYDLDGRLIDAESATITADEFSFTPTFSTAEAVTLKAFVWDDGLTSLADPYKAIPNDDGYVFTQQWSPDGVLPEATRKKRLILMGDSLMDSVWNTSSGVDRKYGWEEFIGNYVDADEVTLIKHGHSGQTIKMFVDGRSTYHYCDWTSIKKQFGIGDYVIIALGTNDNNRMSEYNKGVTTDKNGDATYGTEQFKAWYKDIIADVKAKGATIILLTPPPANGSVASGAFYAPTSLARTAISELATEADVDVIDITQAYADAINAYATANGYTAADMQAKATDGVITESGVIFVDSVHFSEIGADLLAKTVAEQIKLKDTGLEEFITLQ